MDYKIKIVYDTGDSFSSNTGIEEFIPEVSFSNYEEAKQAVIDIGEHYELYMMVNEGRLLRDEKEIKKQLKLAKKKPWFHKAEKRYGLDFSQNQILLGPDRIEVYCFWCGYFESLVSAEVACESHKYTYERF